MEKKVIRYAFADGTVSEVEVDDALFAAHEAMVQKEKCNHWRNTRRHVSLDYLRQHEIDIEDLFSDPFYKAADNEDAGKLHKAILLLIPEQRELVEKVFFRHETITEIAKAENVGKSAIANRLKRIYEKLKKLLS